MHAHMHAHMHTYAGVLLEGGADPNGSDADGTAPLSIASQRGHEGCVLELIARGVNVVQV